METNLRMPILKGKPFFEQLKLSINFIDSNMKLIDNSVKTSNTIEEYNYVKKLLNKVDKYNDEANSLARTLKINSLGRTDCEFEDEIQNLKEILRCKEIEYQLEPFKYKPLTNQQQFKNNQKSENHLSTNQQNKLNQQFPQKPSFLPNNFTNQERRLQLLNKNKPFTDLSQQNGLKRFETSTNYLINNKIEATINLNSQKNSNNLNDLKSSSIKKRDTFLLKENEQKQSSLIKKPFQQDYKFIQPNRKENQADVTNESIDTNNQFSFDFKLPYNKLKNNYFPSNSNFSVDESLEIEFTPGLKTRRTCKKKTTFNESNTSTQDLQPTFDKHGQFDNSIKQESFSKNDLDKQNYSIGKQENLISNKLSTELDRHHSDITFLKRDLSIKQDENPEDVNSPPKNIDKFEEKMKPNKLSTPKKPPNFDLFL